MKRLTNARRRYQLIITRKRTIRSRNSRRKSQKRRRVLNLPPAHTIPPEAKNQDTRFPHPSKTTIRISAPEIFGIAKDASRTKLLQFLTRLRQTTLTHHHKVLIDFQQTKTMHPGGTLRFAAELDWINRQTRPRKLIRCNYPANHIVEQLLQHLGLLEMMGQKGRTTISADDVKYWKIDSDNRVNGQRTESVIEEYRRLFQDQEAKKLYNGLTEAMTNCRQHAYTQEREDTVNPNADTRWWMFSQIKDGQLSVVICDLGIGIPASLRQGRRWHINQIIDFVDKIGLGRKDSVFIKAAMTLGRSRTNEEHRGKGLPELKSVIESVQAGFLKIFSNRGSYYFSAKDNEEDLHDFSTSIMGTLIQWQIPVPKVSNNER